MQKVWDAPLVALELSSLPLLFCVCITSMTVPNKADISKVFYYPKTGPPYFFFSWEPHFIFKLAATVHFLIFLSTEAYLFLAGLESAHHLNVCLWCILAFYHLRFGGSERKWFTQASKITPNCRDVKYAFRSHIFLLHSNLIILLLFQAVRQWKRVTHKFEKKVCLGRSK